MYEKELYAIENGQKKHTKSIKNKKPNKDRKYFLQRQNKNKPGRDKESLESSEKTQESLAQIPSADTTTRSMQRLVKLKEPNFVPVLVVLIKIDRDQFHPVLCLVDSGSSHSFLRLNSMPRPFNQYLKSVMIKETGVSATWQTRAGQFSTAGKAS